MTIPASPCSRLGPEHAGVLQHTWRSWCEKMLLLVGEVKDKLDAVTVREFNVLLTQKMEEVGAGQYTQQAGRF